MSGRYKAASGRGAGPRADFSSYTSNAPGSNGVPSNTLPVGGAQKFFVAVVDTGAQSSILSFDTAAQIDLGSANRLGGYPQQITGASGQETTDITDPIGI